MKAKLVGLICGLFALVGLIIAYLGYPHTFPLLSGIVVMAVAAIIFGVVRLRNTAPKRNELFPD